MWNTIKVIGEPGVLNFYFLFEFFLCQQLFWINSYRRPSKYSTSKFEKNHYYATPHFNFINPFYKIIQDILTNLYHYFHHIYPKYPSPLNWLNIHVLIIPCEWQLYLLIWHLKGPENFQSVD